MQLDEAAEAAAVPVAHEEQAVEVVTPVVGE